MKKDTLCIAVDRRNATNGTGIAGSIQPSTAWQYVDGGDQFYPRYFNTPNQDSVVEKLCKLEGAESGVIFSSGMAAVCTSMMALLQPGDHVILLNGIYGGTNAFVLEELHRIGVETSYVDRNADDFAAAITDATKLIYLESPTNPLLDIVDLQAIADVARARNITTMIDNTFASPILQNPIKHGIDIVVHSGTKYLGGHSDLCCGAVLTSAELGKVIKDKALNYGGSLNAISCYLLERSLKTLAMRVERQTANATELAIMFDEHPLVKRVYYPGLPSHPGHDIAARQMTGFGAMLAFELTDDVAVVPFLKALQVITPALSLGGVESTMCVPALTSHRHMSKEARVAVGLTENVIRYSVGAENVEDLKADVEQAIKVSAKHGSAVVG